MFRKGKTCIIAKLHRTDLVIRYYQFYMGTCIYVVCEWCNKMLSFHLFGWSARQHKNNHRIHNLYTAGDEIMFTSLKLLGPRQTKSVEPYSNHLVICLSVHHDFVSGQ